MAETKERLSKEGALLGPKRADKWSEWRAARDNRIAKAQQRAKPKDDSHERK